jgi:hypothetical protein
MSQSDTEACLMALAAAIEDDACADGAGASLLTFDVVSSVADRSYRDSRS